MDGESHSYESQSNSSITTQEEIPIHFHGNVKEYFGIWIVNVLLIMLTLGVYIPWAKVRSNRYFYANTMLNDVNFDYLANPVTILKGSLIAVIVFEIFILAELISPLLAGILGVTLLPIVVVKAMAFRLRNTAYRNVQFSFKGSVGDAFKVYLLWPILAVLTAGLLMPYVMCRQQEFIVENTCYGKVKFQFSGTASQLYKKYLIGMGITLLLSFVVGGVFAYFGQSVFDDAAAVTAAMIFEGAMFLFVFLIVYSYMRAAITNFIWNNISIEKHQFHSSLDFLYMAWLYLSNTVAILLSFGLLIPWTKIRMIRYRLSQLVLLSHGGLDTFIAARNKEQNAVGEQIGDIMDVDIGL